MSTETKSTKRGRPIVEGSARQAREAAKAEKIANGIKISRGRPKGSIKVKAEVKAA